MIIVKLIDSNKSVVREYRTKTLCEALAKQKHWNKLFTKNTTQIERKGGSQQ